MAVAITAAGCATTQTNYVARTPAVQLQRTQPVTVPGVYMAMWTASDKSNLLPLLGTDHFAAKGDQLGFDRDAGGGLVAVFNDSREPLGPPPPSAKYVVWRHVERKSSGVDFHSQTLLNAVGTGLLITGLVAITILDPSVWFDHNDDDDDCDFVGSHHHHSARASHAGSPSTQPMR